MKIGYLDCFSGISGDMCLGALVDAGVALEAIAEPLSSLHLHGYRLQAERVMRHGVTATKVDVVLDEHEHHPHRGLSGVLEIIESGSLPADVVERASAVFRTLAEAEAHVHNTTVEHVHFHEVGAVDAICDIVGTVLGLRELGLDSLMFGTVAVGGGTVECAHGVLPVPAPATAELLEGMPCVGGPAQRELTTPTGAAVLRTLATYAPAWPNMRVDRVAYGAGGADTDTHPNVLRLVVGEADSAAGTEADCVWVIETNLDDMTGEELGAAQEFLRKAGALDVVAAPVQMKKGRPGTVLTALCRPGDLSAIESAMFRHTSTLGVRRSLWQRSILSRGQEIVETPWGPVRVKTAALTGERVRCEPEYDDCLRLAQENGVSLRAVMDAARRAAGEA